MNAGATLAAGPRIAVFGNCQAPPLGHLLKAMCPAITIVPVPPVHLVKKDQTEDVVKRLARTDVVVHQPVGPAFKELATQRLRERLPGKHFVSFPSLYFNGYSPHLMYLRKPGGGTLTGPINDYHDERVVNAFLRGTSVDEAIAAMDAGGPEEGESALRAALAELRQREEDLDVRCVPFIEARCRSDKLFLVFNHPVTTVLEEVARQVIEVLGLRAGPLPADARKPALDNSEVPVDSAVLRAAAGLAPVAGGYRARRAGSEFRYDARGFVTASYEVYRAVPDFPALVRYAQERRKLLG